MHEGYGPKIGGDREGVWAHPWDAEHLIQETFRNRILGWALVKTGMNFEALSA